MSDDAMIESQRRLAALGLFRRVRITELPRTGSLARDVLVDLEEADTTTIDYGGGLEVSGIGGRADDGSGATDKVDVGPRGFFSISRRNLWGKNRSVTLFGRVTVRRREPAVDNSDPTDDWRIRVQRLSRVVYVPRAARLRHVGRRAVHRVRRTEPADQLHVQSQGPHHRLCAAPVGLHPDGPLHFRLHQGVRRADRGGGPAPDRSPVSAGQAVEVLRRRGAGLPRRRARSAKGRSDRSGRIGGRQGVRIGSRLREDVCARLHLSPAAWPRIRGGGRRAPRRRGRFRAGRRTAARDCPPSPGRCISQH